MPRKRKYKESRILHCVLDWIINLTVLLITLFICFGGLELYFRYKIKWDNTNPSAVNMPIFKESAYRSWDLKPNTKIFHGYESPVPEININSAGLRDDEIPAQKDKRRILLLGDSFVFGMGGYQHQTMSRFLNIQYIGEKYTKVINAGVIGQTIDDAYLYLKYDGIKLKPDIVVYNFFVGNDLTELRRHSQIFDSRGEIMQTSDNEHYITDEGLLRKQGKTEPSSYFLFWLDNKLNPKLADPTLTWPVFFSDDDERGDPNLYKYWNLFVNVLDQMNSFTKKNHIKFIVNIIPMDVQVSKRYWDKYPHMPFGNEEFLLQRPQNRIISILKEKKIDYVDLLPILQTADKDLEKAGDGRFLYYEKDPHFNKLGNMWSAYGIYEGLLSKSYFK